MPVATNPKPDEAFEAKHLGILQLLLVVALWGGTLPLSLIASRYDLMLPIAARHVIAAIPLLGTLRGLKRRTLTDGLQLGALGLLVQIGQIMSLQGHNINRTAIIGSLNLCFMPIVLTALGRKLPRTTAWYVLLGLAGAATMGAGLDYRHWTQHDLWALLRTAAFTWQTLLLERCAPRHNPIQLTAVQVGTIGLASGIMLLSQPIHTPSNLLLELVPSLLFLGLGATLLASILRTAAQRHLPANTSTALLSLEPASTAAFTWLSLGQRPSLPETIGGILITIAGIFMPGEIRHINNPDKLRDWLELVGPGEIIFSRRAALRSLPEARGPYPINTLETLERFKGEPCKSNSTARSVLKRFSKYLKVARPEKPIKMRSKSNASTEPSATTRR